MIIFELHLTPSSKMFQALNLMILLLETNLIMKFPVMMEMTHSSVVPVTMSLIGQRIVEMALIQCMVGLEMIPTCFQAPVTS